jgi:hypothetical protein
MNGRIKMQKSLFLGVLLIVLSACSYLDDYEAQVYDKDPLYCYKSLGEIQCYKKPQAHDERRFVNYYGPHPSRYEKPTAAPESILSAPPPVDFYVRDPEPIPTSNPLPEKGVSNYVSLDREKPKQSE